MAIIERYSVDSWVPSWIRFMHLIRYEWAANQVRGQTVIDAACGTGYGARMLAEAGASEIRAYDVDEVAVADARRRCADQVCVHVEPGDVTRLPLSGGAADAYVCFETIEHVQDDAAVVAEAARVLKPGGLFLCSSPNREITNAGTRLTDRPFNPHHCREYNLAEFHELLRQHFSHVELFGQMLFPVRWQRILTFLCRIHPGLAVKAHQMRKLTNWSWARAARYWPQPIPPGTAPECFLAVAQR
jgi:ubiquinone/menaquinone biosynthesis C-methylase UbiE